MDVRFNVNIADVIALLISGIAIFLAIKNRNNSLRENLYDRQLNFFTEFMSSVSELEETLENWEMAHDSKNEMERLDHSERFLLQLVKVGTIQSKFAFLIPDELDDEFMKFKRRCYHYNELLFKGELNEKRLDGFSDVIFDLEDSIRDYIGLEKLSRENQKLTS